MNEGEAPPTPNNVLDFRSAKAKKESAPQKYGDYGTAPVGRIVTNQAVFQQVYEDIIDDWQKHAAKNQLRAFVESKIPAFARGAENADYVGDLNVIANVELKLGMKVTILYPETTPGNPHGWLVSFHRGKEPFSAPPDMASEAYARALNVLLYLAFEIQMKRLKR